MPQKKQSRKSKIRRRAPQKSQNSFKKRISVVDPSDLKSDYEEWPRMSSRIWNAQSTRDRFSPQRPYARIILTGMGGSGITGEVIADLGREAGSKISFETIKDYHLPNYVNDNTLVVGMSSSGNTEETLSVLSEAYSRGIDAWTFGSGGLIQNLSQGKWGFKYVKTEMLKVPRSSLPGMFFYVLSELERSGLLEISENDVRDSLNALNVVGQKCKALDDSNPALKLARELLAPNFSSPLIYASNRTRAAALRARQSINENAKMHLFDGVIPELCHNDIVGWDSASARAKKLKSNFKGEPNPALLLRLEDDPVEVKTRFQILEEVIRSAGGRVLEAPYLRGGYFTKIISMIYYLDYCSYYMAIIRGIDPIKTPSITLLKDELSRRLDFVSRLK